jgi:hypothetical protein
VADFETLKTLFGYTRGWMTSDGGFDAKTGRYAYKQLKTHTNLREELLFAT